MISNFSRLFSTSEPLKKTALNSLHKELGGEMVPFCGWEMPVKFQPITKAHLHTRESAGLFDVSHMGQVFVAGPDREKFMEAITVADVSHLPMNKTQLSVLTTPDGGIIDDLMITRREGYLYVVINAGCKEKDLKHMKRTLCEHPEWDVTMSDISEERQLIALQGPKAKDVLSRFVDYDLSKQPFMSQCMSRIMDIPCYVTRCGYTGEDGFEISVPTIHAELIARILLDEEEVLPIGLGARDSLRLEGGFCLYGNDITTLTTPVEAGLTWLISKRRRKEGGFLGDETIKEQLASGVLKKRVGFIVDKGAPARHGAKIYDATGKHRVGVVTSGGYSPCLKKPIGEAHVNIGHNKVGTKLMIQVRKKMVPVTVAKMPFVPFGYK
ncbi:Aminomethyltransferase, mitochondrial [Aduncisulcus paluster]|uniref:Aminomethyltransferase n=1 Tax=Aduncisulcus paluster TaxID=2918883 RepID=A0ABQ5KCW6_9EUKA|nr:Aminomethyltransferase, mitochondrial [Aduncisulcus paluster]